jgi:hypothetical protein
MPRRGKSRPTLLRVCHNPIVLSRKGQWVLRGKRGNGSSPARNRYPWVHVIVLANNIVHRGLILNVYLGAIAFCKIYPFERQFVRLLICLDYDQYC